jgi:pimeloyl-ACP methyl ester carboxylesterase
VSLSSGPTMPPLPAPRTMRLRDGRLVELAEYGDPAGAPALFFHGFIGSHHQVAFAAEAARRQGLRVVALNRPGVGRSTPCDRRELAECADDARQVADALGLSRFGVIGASGGAPYALACLARLPGRALVAGLLSGLGPVGEPGVLGQMEALPRSAMRIGQFAPWLVRATLWLRARRFRIDPDGFLDDLLQTWSRADRRLFERPEVRALFLADVRQVLVDGEGPNNLAKELGLYFRWGFRLSEVPAAARVLLWHGREDRLVPAFMGEYVAQAVPGAELTLLPGGHFTAVPHAEEIVGRLVAALRAGASPGETRRVS